MPLFAFGATFSRVVTALVVALMYMTPGKSEELAVVGKRLVKADYCEGQVLVEDYLYNASTARSKVDCVSRCHPNSACMAVVYETDTGLCHLGVSKAAENCSNMEPAPSSALFYQEPPPCGYGEVRGHLGLCICAPGFAGVPCTRYYHDCDDIKLYGDWANDGVYTIYPPRADQPLRAYCRYITSTRTYLMDRRKPLEDFDRPYLDYRNGFGDPETDHWLGLQNIYALTADRPYELRINLKVMNNTSYILEYKDFKITDEASGYRILFNESVIPRPEEDCLLPVHGAKFSANDRDRDESDTVQCAQLRKGGFWYRGDACGTCNPHGVLYQPENGTRLGLEDEAFWEDLLGDLALYKISMYIIPMIV